MYKIVTATMENIKMTKRMDMVYLLGIVVMFTKEITGMTKETAMARCFG
jgi:hypothetical protein